MKTALKIAIIAATALILTSCGNVEKLLKGNDFEAQYTAAMDYYNQKNYTKAIQLFENLIMHYHDKTHAEDISWYYGMCLMGEQLPVQELFQAFPLQRTCRGGTVSGRHVQV